MSNSIVGKDVTVWTVQGLGNSSESGNVSNGATFNLLGTWKDIEITINKKWVDRTPSGGDWEVKRRTTRGFKGSAKNMVDANGSPAIALAMANDFVLLTFTTGDGHSIQVFAGIDEGGITAGQDAVNDSLNFSCVGNYNGGDPIQYV